MKMKNFFVVLGFFLFIASVALAWFGLQFMYDNSWSNRVVGGDAYNFIIYATRGTAFVCAGIVSSVLALCCFVFSSSLAVHVDDPPEAKED